MLQAYQKSFGDLPTGTVYHLDDNDPVLKAQAERIKAEVKALTTTAGGAGTAGYAMVPIYVDPRIVDQSRKYTPLVEMIPRVTNNGMTADFNVITAKGAAVAAAEDAALTDVTDTEDRKSTSIKFLYSVGRVTGPMKAAMPSYTLEGFQATGSGLAGTSFSPAAAPNAKQYEVIKRARALREKEESLIVNGDASTTTEEFSGFVKLQGTTNKKDLNTSALSYGDIEDAVKLAVDDSGRPNLAVCDTSTLADLRKIMIDTFHYRPVDMTVKLPFGVSSHLVLETAVGPVPVLFSQYLSTTGGSKSLYFLDLTVWEMRVLQDMTYEDLAKTNDSEKFMLKIYEALICRSTSFNSFVGEIA